MSNKKKGIIVGLVPLLGVFLIVVSKNNSFKSSEKGQKSFNAIVLEDQENNFLVEPIEGEFELKSSDKIKVTKDIISKDSAQDVKIGDEIRIVYNGEIMESYPVRLGVVYAIYRADELE
ncbi:DUF3221 domain-containing protein [Clostridium sp. LP20]|uniref:DUF3221 domain-containing protein n=1 Tax=Clostridium sp. LP20 TaxID=3418665 RepID=UPI003EE66342